MELTLQLSFSKMFLALILVWTTALRLSVGTMTLQQYASSVKHNEERRYTPLSPLMCLFNPRLRSLKSCILARSRSRLLPALSFRFLSKTLNSWSTTASGNSLVASSVVTSRLQEAMFGRVRNKLKQTKKANPRNPCVSGRPRETIVWFGVDAETGEVVELLHDLENHLYQTFYMRRCVAKKYFSFDCVEQFVEFKAAVFRTNSYEVSVRRVKIPVNCALHVG